MEQEFLTFVADILCVDKNDLNMGSKYGETENWDSLMQLRLVAEICDQYGVDIPIDEVPEIKTLGDFYRYVEAKQ